MKYRMAISVAALLITAAGTAFALDADGAEGIPSGSSQPQGVEFTPMTRSERLRNYLTGTFGPGSLARAAARAGFDQVLDRPTEWDSNGRGFADRLGNAYAKHIIRQTLQYGASTALHEDDRYLVSGEKGFWNRTRYALASTFLARRDNGERCFATARMSGAAGAAFISRAWQPGSTSGAGSAAGSFGLAIAGDSGANVVKEFWPDLKRHFRRN